MEELLCKSDFKRSLNSSRGKSRREAARLTRGASSASAEGSSESGRESRSCTAWSSWSLRERLGMGPPHARPQALQGAKLQLLDCALAAAQVLGDFANALLLHKTHNDHALLVRRQLVYEAKQGGALLNLAHGHRVGIGDVVDRRGQPGLAARLLPAVGHGMGGQTVEPGGERHASPLKAAQVGQGAVEDLGGHILGFGAIAHTTDHERV